MSALMNKVWNFFGMDTPESDMDLDGEDMYNQPYTQNYGQEEVEENDIEANDDDDAQEPAEESGEESQIAEILESDENMGSTEASDASYVGRTVEITSDLNKAAENKKSDEICAFLKERKSIIVNLEYVNKDVARRIVDFISGGVYALDGYIQKVSNSIFLVAPSNYEITNEMAREEMRNKLSVSWLKNNNLN